MEQIITTHPFWGFAESRIGGRAENQDSCGYIDTPEGLLVVVCDGMGGGPGGKVASSTVVNVVTQMFFEHCNSDLPIDEVLRICIIEANEVLLQKMQEYPSLMGMGTTIAALYISKEYAIAAHVGDSRIYKLRGSTSLYRTKDHSFVGEMVRSGTLTEEQARLSSQSNIITKVIGRSGKNEPDIEILPFEKGDRFILCSDGIWNSMPEPKLIKCFSEKRPISNLVEAIANKVDSIGRTQDGSYDNLTLVIIETKTDSKLKEQMNRRARYTIGALCILLVVSVLFNLFQMQARGRKIDFRNMLEKKQKELVERDSTIKKLKAELETAHKTNRNLKKIARGQAEENLDDRSKEAERAKVSENSQENVQKKENVNEKEEQADIAETSFDTQIDDVIKKLRELKGVNANQQKDCTRKVGRLQEEIKSSIGELIKENPEKEKELKYIQKQLNTANFDRKVVESKTKRGKYYVLASISQDLITELIYKLESIKKKQ